jgi:hypothetical protein
LGARFVALTKIWTFARKKSSPFITVMGLAKNHRLSRFCSASRW